METGDKNIIRAGHAPYMFCEENLGDINAKDVELFWNGSNHKLYHLKALITLEQVHTSVIRKKRRIFDGEANWLGVVNFHCIQMSTVMSMQVTFDQQWLKWQTTFITFLLSGNDVISLKLGPPIFVCL